MTDCEPKQCEEPSCEALHPNASSEDPSYRGWKCPKHLSVEIGQVWEYRVRVTVSDIGSGKYADDQDFVYFAEGCGPSAWTRQRMLQHPNWQPIWEPPSKK